MQLERGEKARAQLSARSSLVDLAWHNDVYRTRSIAGANQSTRLGQKPKKSSRIAAMAYRDIDPRFFLFPIYDRSLAS
jgi:hypothetical protein